MTGVLDRVRNFVTQRSLELSGSTELEPEVGFKVVINERSKELRVIIIGVRNLPASFGVVKTEGYVIKVVLYPGKAKHETKVLQESCPVLDEEFPFQMETSSTSLKDLLRSNFIVLTVYAVLEKKQTTAGPSLRRVSLKSKMLSLMGQGKGIERQDRTRRSVNRMSLDEKRTVGAVTYRLDPNVFNLVLRNKCISTPDIWRPIQAISSGLDIDTSRESKKGSVELTLTYSTSEDGKNDMFLLTIQRLRCSLSTMQEHENLRGQLYLKVKFFERGVVVAKWKSIRFEPTISQKLAGALQATVQNYNLSAVKAQIWFRSRNRLGKKTALGSVTLDKTSDQWKRAVSTPTYPVSDWQHFA